MVGASKETTEAAQTKEEEDVATLGDMTDKRVRWSLEAMRKKRKLIRKEFNEYRKYTKPATHTYSYFNKNKRKNRYSDVICIDATRVVLKNRKPDNDYIHANWVTMPDGYRYICTQGPQEEVPGQVDDTIEDFWHMVVTEKCSVIVMICRLCESKTSKCDSYYPDAESPSADHGPYKIQYVRQEKDLKKNICVHVYELQHNGQKRQITHYQYLVWKELVAPIQAAPAVELLREARAKAKDTPMVVHCSSGIGRTGTFVAIDYAVQKVKKDENYRMMDLVKEIWSMRYNGIQTGLQYMFLHWAVVEYFAQEGVVNAKSLYYTKFKADCIKSMKKNCQRVFRLQEEKRCNTVDFVKNGP